MKETWRDVWEETCAAMANLEQCIETVVEVERALLRQQQRRTSVQKESRKPWP